MKTFDLAKLDSKWLEELGCHYENEGYCILTGLTELVTNRFYAVVAETLGIDSSQLAELLDPLSPQRTLPAEVRQKMARVSTTPDLARGLLAALRPVLQHLLGPLVHISANFHAQFKCGVTGRVGYGGYNAQQQYMEVHGAYQLHQDFTGASFPTSPSHMILWVGLNACPDWPVRLYPRSHRLGLLCDRFVPVDHPRLAQLDKPIEFQARPGTGILFNALLLHGTGDGGERRRVSCDLRFFPACGFLQSHVHSLTESPWNWIQDSLQTNPGAVRRAPLLENLALSGDRIHVDHLPCGSILNWANYLGEFCNGSPDRAIPHLRHFANTEIGLEAANVYVTKFHGHPMNKETLQRIRDLVIPRAAASVGRG